MLVNFDKTGRVVWYNLYVSKEAAESCLCDNTIWLDTSLHPFPEPKEGFVVYLKLNEEQQLIYDYEPQPEPVYTDLQIIMQGLSDLACEMYEILKKKYKLGYVRKDQLQRYLTLGKLTEEEYQDIIQF